MSTKYFPNISEDQVLLIKRVLRNMDETPGFLDDPDCGYSTVIKDFLKSRAAPAGGAEAPNLFEGDEVVAITTQIQKIINDLEVYGQSLQSGDTSEKLQYFKTKNSLLEKLLNNMERANNLKQVNEFRSIVIQFMDEVLTKDQITTFMQRIDGVLSNGK